MLCPICKEKPRESFSTNYVSVWKCGNRDCGHLYADNPIADQGVQEHSHPELDYLKWKGRNDNLVHFLQKKQLVSDNSRILDVGTGAGHIIRSFRNYFPTASITCIEPNQQSRAYLLESGFTLVNSFDELKNDFDAVLLIEVIEHVADPVSLLKSCKRHMAEAARIFLTTPCGELHGGNRKTPAYDTKEHIQFFTLKSLRLACKLAGFQDFEYCYTDSMTYFNPSSAASVGAFALKSILRPLRNSIFGAPHLTGFVR